MMERCILRKTLICTMKSIVAESWHSFCYYFIDPTERETLLNRFLIRSFFENRFENSFKNRFEIENGGPGVPYYQGLTVVMKNRILVKDGEACKPTWRMISCSDNEVCQMTKHHRDGRSEMYQFCAENFKWK